MPWAAAGPSVIAGALAARKAARKDIEPIKSKDEPIKKMTHYLVNGKKVKVPDGN